MREIEWHHVFGKLMEKEERIAANTVYCNTKLSPITALSMCVMQVNKPGYIAALNKYHI